MKSPAVFFDRDGVIIKEKNFLAKVEGIEFLPGAVAALKKLGPLFLKIIVTNQSGIARGYFNSIDVETLHSHISQKLSQEGIRVDAWYYCPHGPDDACDCRKPRPGLIARAADEHLINLQKSWMIGDKSSDIMAGKSTGVKTILVSTGYGGAEPGAFEVEPDFNAADLSEAIDIINEVSGYEAN